MQDHTAKMDSSNLYANSNGDILLVGTSGGSSSGVQINTGKSFSTQNPMLFDGLKEYNGQGAPRVGSETRPVNRTVIKWKRTA